MPFKILIMGLPGSGKTHLALQLAYLLDATHFNADVVRHTISRDLGFSLADRIEQARRMGVLCDIANATGKHAIADFVCPTEEARAAFGPCFTIWLDTIKVSRYEDTNLLFVPPNEVDYLITSWKPHEEESIRLVLNIEKAIAAVKLASPSNYNF
jgi:RNase adaptor protein for sRNA GlmZ degradation